MLTASQHRTYTFISQYIEQNGYAPTIREIAQGLGLRSRTNIHKHIHKLAEKGFVNIIPNARRNIEIIKKDNNFSLPLLGRIAAGSPIETVTENSLIDFTPVFNKPDRYILKVKGDSMIEDGIFDGDLVICDKVNTVKNGDIVVALIDNHEATLKRIERNRNHTVTLHPANSALKPITVPAKQVQIQGVVVGLIRLA